MDDFVTHTSGICPSVKSILLRPNGEYAEQLLSVCGAIKKFAHLLVIRLIRLNALIFAYLSLNSL